MTADKWISVKDELPAWFQEVIIAHQYGVTAGYIDDVDEWHTIKHYKTLRSVTHWMPMPQMPKEEKHDESQT